MRFTKDPDAVLDYTFDWSGWLADTETITAQTVTATDGITIGDGAHATSQAGGIVTVWLSGGTDRTTYTVTCHITTSEGREDDRSFAVEVRQR